VTKFDEVIKRTRGPYTTDKISRSIRYFKDFSCKYPTLLSLIWFKLILILSFLSFPFLSFPFLSFPFLFLFEASEWLYLFRFGYPGLTFLELDPNAKELLENTWLLILEFLLPEYTEPRLRTLTNTYKVWANSVWNHFGWDRKRCSLNWHLPVHHVRLIRQWGPLIYQWCWVIERLNQQCKVNFDLGIHIQFFTSVSAQ